MSIQSEFTPEELEAIRRATQAAERRTGGELVCVIVQQSDVYESAVWKAAALGAVGGSVGAGLWVTFAEAWVVSAMPWILLPPVLGAAFSTLLVLALPGLRRALISPAVVDRRLDRRAAKAFLDEEIFDTRARTGVLLFVSLFEHGIRILRDKGVEERVTPEAWQPIVDKLSSQMRSGRKATAIVAAIDACGRLLQEHGVARPADDTDELSDQPRLYDE